MFGRTPKPVPVHNLKVSRAGKVKKRSFLWRMRRVFYLAALAVTVGAGGLIYVVSQVELPVDPTVAPVEDQTSFICSSEVQVNCNASNAMAQLHGTEDRVLVSYDQIPDVLTQAVLAVEDKDFFEHSGVDPVGITRAAYRDIRNEGVRQGGSTITQQYVKQEFLSSEQTVTRKVKEAMMAIKLEQEISKEEILTRYLNTVYFGRGAYGVQAASRAWFGHDVAGVDAGQAAFLAGLLRFPNGADPYRGDASLDEAVRRRGEGLRRMWEDGYITAEERELYSAVPLDPTDATVPEEERVIVAPPKASVLGEEVKGAEWGSEYFAEQVRRWLIEEYSTDVVYGGGLKVYTTLDLDMQKAAYDAVTTTFDREDDPSGALVALDDVGQVKAMMGGTDFENDKVNLAMGAAGGGLGRQPGSTFKAFALADAIRKGYSVRSLLPAPGNIEIDRSVCPNGDAGWKVRGGPGGTASLVTATRNSTNTVYAQLMAAMRPESVVQTAYDLGVATELKEVCSIVLGGGEVSVLDMAAGYSTFANEGTAKAPIMVTRVEFPDGRVDNFTPETTEPMTPLEARRVTYALEQVIDGGTGKAANFGRPAAGKTGTTQGNADAWFVGYTPKLTAAVWVGFPEGLISMDNVRGLKVQGGNFPSEIWRKFMTTATADFDTGDFPEIESDELGAGEILDPNLGLSRAIGGAPPPVPTPTTRPQSSSPATTAPSAPATTAPATTAPATTAPATTAPAPTVPTTSPTPSGGGDTGQTEGKEPDSGP